MLALLVSNHILQVHRLTGLGTYISFLRKKLFFLGSKVNIGTVRKVGYRLEEDAS